MRLHRALMAFVLAIATLVVPAVLATNQAQAYACKSTDKFSGTVSDMVHFVRCNHIPYALYTMGDPRVQASWTPAAAPKSPDVTAPGGPRCAWQTKHIVQICLAKSGSGAGTWAYHLICAQYWSGSYYPYHCGPAQAYNLTHAEGLWSVVKRAFTSHAARACVRGTIAGSTTAVILKAAGSATGIGVVASLAGGCVGGIITYFWKI